MTGLNLDTHAVDARTVRVTACRLLAPMWMIAPRACALSLVANEQAIWTQSKDLSVTAALCPPKSLRGIFKPWTEAIFWVGHVRVMQRRDVKLGEMGPTV